MVCRLPTWPWMIGIRLSRLTLSWASWLQGCRTRPWAKAHLNQLTNPSSSSFFENATTSSLGGASSIEKMFPKNPRRPYFNWSCWPHMIDCHERVSWWDWPPGPQKDVWPDVWPFVLALNGYSGKETHWEVLPVHHLQGEPTAGSHGEYCGYPSPGTSAHWLPVPGAKEG